MSIFLIPDIMDKITFAQSSYRNRSKVIVEWLALSGGRTDMPLVRDGEVVMRNWRRSDVDAFCSATATPPSAPGDYSDAPAWLHALDDNAERQFSNVKSFVRNLKSIMLPARDEIASWMDAPPPAPATPPPAPATPPPAPNAPPPAPPPAPRKPAPPSSIPRMPDRTARTMSSSIPPFKLADLDAVADAAHAPSDSDESSADSFDANSLFTDEQGATYSRPQMHSAVAASSDALVERILQNPRARRFQKPKTADEYYQAVRHSILSNSIGVEDLEYAFDMEGLTITQLSSELYKGPNPVRDITDALWGLGESFRELGRKAGYSELGLESSPGKNKGFLPNDQAIAFLRQCALRLASRRRANEP